MSSVHRLIVSARLGNFFAIKIDHEPVSDATLVRRAIIQRDAGHERRLKPPAMLIGRLQIHVGRITQLGMQRTNGAMRDAAVDPNVDRVVAFGCSSGKSQLLGKIDIVQFEPDIRAALGDEIGEFANYFRVENWFAIGRVKNR